MPAVHEQEKPNGEYSVVHKYPGEVVLGVNIRPRDGAFIAGLAQSIRDQGQLQECIGDTLPDETIRVWAGQHRYLAVKLINDGDPATDTAPTPMQLRIRAYHKEFTPEQVLAVQLAENLHNQMAPEEEAEAIQRLWEIYTQVFAQSGKKTSMADLARRIGRGPGMVRAALAFSSADEDVRALVGRGALLYSVGVEVARLPEDKQLATAVRIIEYNLDRHRAEILIKVTLGELEGYSGSLFNPEQQSGLDADNHRIALRTAADRAGQDAAGYFMRVLHLIQVLDKRGANDVTPAVADILARLIASSRMFELMLRQEAPSIGDMVEQRSQEMLAASRS